MLLKDILKDYNPPYPLGVENLKWSDTFQYINHTKGESEIVSALIKDFLSNGKFREPIILSPADDEEKYIFNGVHRITALYNMEEWERDIETLEGYPPSDVSIVIDAKVNFLGISPEDIIDAIMEMSYPLSKEFWVEVEGIATTRDENTIQAHFGVAFRKGEEQYLESTLTSLEEKVSSIKGYESFSYVLDKDPY